MRSFTLGLFLFFLYPSLSAQHLLYKGGWKLSENQSASFPDASCTHPMVVVEEDFTDSLFNGFNAGPNGSNWNFFAGGVAFRKPNNRSTFPLAVSRKPFVSAGGWAGVLWGKRKNPALGHSDDNLVEYKIDKKDDIFITRFKAFSDFAHTNERAGVEVANMETRDVLCPPPDFCHDLSFEAKQNFYWRPQDDLQLESNVENKTDRSPFGARRAHYNNLTGKADLEKEYENLVVWRNDPVKRKCNIEQWGAANYADFWLDTHMVSKLDPGNRYAIISEVQVSLFAGDTNFAVLRNGMQKKDAQIGILNVHSGISKCSDFNLDYKTNDADLQVLKKYLGRSDSATIRRGDANNDAKITGEDCNALTAFWSDSTQYPDSAFATAVYTQTTAPPNPQGIIKINVKKINYLSISFPDGAFLNQNDAFSQLADVEYTTSNRVRSYFSKNGFNLQNIEIPFAPGNTSVSDVRFTVNYLGSCQSGGFTFKMDSTFSMVTAQNSSLETLENVKIAGLNFAIPAHVQAMEISILDPIGRLLKKEVILKNQATSFETVQYSGPVLLVIQDQASGVVIGRSRLISSQN